MPLLVVLYIVLPVVQLVFFLAGRPIAGPADALNYASSILAFHWLSANVLLSAKVPLLQCMLPYDARIRFHILASAGIAALTVYHAAYKIILGKRIDAVAWILGAALISMLFSAVLWIPVPGFVSFRNKALEILRRESSRSYDRTKAFHGYFVLALALLIFLHVANAGLFDDVGPVSLLLYLLLYAFSFGLFALSKTGFFRTGATVIGVTPSRDILTIRLAPDRPHRFRSGQFAFLRARGPLSRREEHPFSYLSTPGEKEIQFAVRACGDFTAGLASLKAGDRVRISGGFGNFRPRKEAALCFIASGIGTVPFISLLKEFHATGDRRPLLFFLAVTYEEEIPDLEVIRRISGEMPNLSLRLLVYSVDQILYSTEFFRAEVSDPRSFAYYICSSPRVRDGVVRSLADLGVSKSVVHYEAFSLG